MSFILIFRIEYSSILLISGFILSIIINLIDTILFEKGYITKNIYAYIPLGLAAHLPNLNKEIRWFKLNKPSLRSVRVKGIVADLYNKQLPDRWLHFIAEKSLQNIDIIDSNFFAEQITQRVFLNTVGINELSSYRPSKIYLGFKYLIDLVLIIITSPIVIPICLIVAFLIKLDGGKVIYKQERIGYKNKTFIIYKFRSMKEDNEEVITTDNDDRITSVGKFIRKFRIDEIPQFINVLKGDMSLIGPRAEFKKFAEQLEKDIPFYPYRHIVRPGISGLAQVIQGYATGTEESSVKLEHDLFYIKNFSFGLDIDIFFKTIKTILCGFGAR